MQTSGLPSLFQTLRFKLLVWNSVVVILSVGITLVALRMTFRLALLRETDQLLLEDAAEIELAAKAMHPDMEAIRSEIDRHTASHRHRGLFVQVFTQEGHPIWSSGSSPLPLLPQKKLLPNGQYTSQEGFRTLDRRLRIGGKEFPAIRIGSKLSLVDQDVADLTWLILGCMAGVIILAPVGGYLLAVRATRPVADVLEKTSQMLPQNPSDRLPRTGSGDELDRLAETMNRFLDRIAANLRSHKNFISHAAHELRSPLTAIGASADVALQRDRNPKEYQEVLSDISDKCEHFRLLVNRLLTLAQAEVPLEKTSTTSASLKPLVEKALEVFGDAAIAKGITIRQGRIQDLCVHCEYRMLQQVVNNLLDNALKYTQGGGEVFVSLETKADKALLRVADTGIGISGENLPLIFDQFYQVDPARSSQEPYSGFGLGLSICKAVVVSAGGSIGVDSTPGKGTTFSILLPLAGSEGPAN